MFCALDKIDLAATVDGRQVAIQTDHRAGTEIADQLELSIVFAMTRVLNARESNSTVYYVVSSPPAALIEALRAAGAVISEATSWQASIPVQAVPPIASEQRAGEIADHCMSELARQAAARLGTRDVAMALRMLEDQTLIAPPTKGDDAAFWRRVVELAALTGELLRVKAGKLGAVGRWVQTDRAVVPFGFEITRPGSAITTLFPTNRAQRVVELGRDGEPGERMLDLLAAAEEALERPADPATGRLMPSLRDRANVELDETVWQPLLADGRAELPIIVCGIDGESTFGMVRRDALQRTPDAAMAEALANLAAEDVEIGQWQANDIPVLAISGSFYAAEKLLDRGLLRELHATLGTPMLYAGVPARGVLLVAAGDEALRARFAMLVRARYEDAGGRQISPAVLVIEDGAIVGCVRDTANPRPDTAPIRAETSPELGAAHSDPERPSVQIRRPGLLRRLLGRK